MCVGGGYVCVCVGGIRLVDAYLCRLVRQVLVLLVQARGRFPTYTFKTGQKIVPRPHSKPYPAMQIMVSVSVRVRVSVLGLVYLSSVHICPRNFVLVFLRKTCRYFLVEQVL